MILTSKLKGGVLQAGSTVILNVFWWSFFYPHNLKITQLQKLRNGQSYRGEDLKNAKVTASFIFFYLIFAARSPLFLSISIWERCPQLIIHLGFKRNVQTGLN